MLLMLAADAGLEVGALLLSLAHHLLLTYCHSSLVQLE